MDKAKVPSTFQRYYASGTLVDRFANDRACAVDVIIPLMHTNELWRANLRSIYREIPVNRLLLGDGGCIDDSLEIAREFPRVEILDHRSFTSLGFSLRLLIEAVRTEWFVYLHSDVYLSEGWFDAMHARRDEYDWFESNQRVTVLAEYPLDTISVARGYSGSQMGRKSAFATVLPRIDDDYLYRNEDIILASLVSNAGFRYGKVRDAIYFHQLMFKPSSWSRNVKHINIEPDLSREEEIRANSTYVRGIVKYLEPDDVSFDIIASMRAAVVRLIELRHTTLADFRTWVHLNNPAWSAEFAYPRMSLSRFRNADRLERFASGYRRHGLLGMMLRATRQLLGRPHGQS
jgi:hypothetical protein